jgi:hypothetical protein
VKEADQWSQGAEDGKKGGGGTRVLRETLWIGCVFPGIPSRLN